MNLTATAVELPAILPLRALFLQENNFQIRYNACHERGWTTPYLLACDATTIGYGSVKGQEGLADRDTVFEFYVLPTHRHLSIPAFGALLRASGAAFIECQSNDRMLTSCLYQYAENINSEVLLFEAGATTDLRIGNVLFRQRSQDDVPFTHESEPPGEYVLELDKEIVATGGFLLHYNFPFADLYMEVKEEHRGKGFGSFLIQEVKEQCYRTGRVPAARCNRSNTASRATLLKGGLQIAGFMLLGKVRG